MPLVMIVFATSVPKPAAIRISEAASGSRVLSWPPLWAIIANSGTIWIRIAWPSSKAISQNWTGGTRPATAAFVPPPPELVSECMSALEAFLHDDRSNLPLLVKAGLVHVPFETIHPFLDGNGRLGRLLITFL